MGDREAKSGGNRKMWRWRKLKSPDFWQIRSGERVTQSTNASTIDVSLLFAVAREPLVYKVRFSTESLFYLGDDRNPGDSSPTTRACVTPWISTSSDSPVK